MNTNCAVLLVGHGTVTSMSDVPEFLRRIRRGRPAGEELVAEIQRRYAHIGGSPLLLVTESLASGLSARLGLPVHVAMRFWDPLIEDVLAELVQRGVREVCVLPVAPFSVSIYVDVVREALALHGSHAPKLVSVCPYGSHPALVAAHADAIRPFVTGRTQSDTELIMTAHSLPTRVLAAGDSYQTEFEHAVRAILAKVAFPGTVAYQSQGADGGEWLGPTLFESLEAAKNAGKRRVVVAPVGFLADHIETLYDLDVEAAVQAAVLELEFERVPAFGDRQPLVDALALVVEEALG
jgi:ferrochelatase